MTSVGFYPGCSLKGTSNEYAKSTLALASEFNIDMIEITDWNCCGATSVHSIDHQMAIFLASRILALAERQKLQEIVVPCASCYNRLKVAQYELNTNEQLKKNIINILQMPININVNILNIIQFIEQYIINKLEKKTIIPFSKKVVCYYGCLLIRPYHILKFDRKEDPQSMDFLLKKTGANSLEWAYKTECCGAGLSISRTDIVTKLSSKIILDAINKKADAIIVACPMCHSNLDMRRSSIDKHLGLKTIIPILYVTQVFGLICGLNKKKIGIQNHFIKVDF